MNRVVKINAGGRTFQTYLSTLTRFPDSSFAKMLQGKLSSVTKGTELATHAEDAVSEVFLDVSPDVFERVLGFLRTDSVFLPTDNEALRADLVHYLHKWDLLPHAFPPAPTDAGEDAELVALPDVCVVQLCDHMQHDQGVKRHAMTITYGADGFQLRELIKSIRKDLNMQLSSTYWQCYQTNERAAFFTTTKVANGSADLLTTSITQQIIAHTESMGYHLTTSYVTLSPDIIHTSVRMLIHSFVFRRTRAAALEEADQLAMEEGLVGGGKGEEEELEVFPNFEPRHVGPQRVQQTESRPPVSERIKGRVL